MKKVYNSQILRKGFRVILLLFFNVTLANTIFAQTLIPYSGNNSIACGTNTTLCTHAGCGTTYSNSANGYTVLNAAGSSIISISGTYSTESSWDFIRIYTGVGTGGTLLATYSGSGSISYTGTAGETLTVSFTSDGSVTNTGLNATVTYSGSCSGAATLIPYSGNNSVSCGTNTTLCTHAGCGTTYSNSANGYTVLNAAGSSIISISGTYSTESSWDFIRIYTGVGTGGTLLATYSGSGSISYTGTAGETLTVSFTSDGSVTNTGLNATVTYSGSCSTDMLVPYSGNNSFTTCSGNLYDLRGLKPNVHLNKKRLDFENQAVMSVLGRKKRS